MAEYYAVLSKAAAGLTESAEARRKVYDKARNALISQLKAIDPPLPTAEISRQRLELEEAIRRVERETAAAAMNAAPKAPRRPQQPPAARRPAPPQAGAYDQPPPTQPPQQPVPQAQAAPPPQPPPPPPVSGGPEDVFRRAIEDAGARDIHNAAAAQAGYSNEPDIGYSSEPTYQQPDFAEPPGQQQQQPPPSYAMPQQDYAAAPAYQPPPPQQMRAEPYGNGAPGRRPPVEASPELLEVEHATAYPPADRYDAPDLDVRGGRGGGGGRSRGGNMDIGSGALPEPFVDDAEELPPAGGGGRGRRRSRERRPSRLPAIFLTLLLLLLLGGLGAIGWSERDRVTEIIAAFDQGGGTPPAQQPSNPQPGGLSEPAKVADRLLSGVESGDDVRVVGPQTDDLASGAQQILTTPDGGDLNALVAQRATLYEEPLNAAAAGEGVVAIDAEATWSFDGSGPSGPEVVAELRVPDRNLNIKLSFRKNDDETLPASHLVEVVSQGAIVRVSQVPRLVMKATESGRGQPLIGAAAKVDDGLFWIALSDSPEDISTNVALLRDRNWIDLPLVYESGQRAILTIEKGTPGSRVLGQALTAWGN